jgi:hypothetical protein
MIFAPIFQMKRPDCKLNEGFKFFRDGQTGKSNNANNIFSMLQIKGGKMIELKVNRTRVLNCTNLASIQLNLMS